MTAWRLIPLVLLTYGCSDSSDRPAPAADVDYAANAQRWIIEEFQPSTLTEAQQQTELAWFTAASEDLRGTTINVVSETLTTHEYESTTLADAFFDITGIRVTHDLIQEGDVIEKL
ncbi:MAG: carbohydrate ABC transporter substrate-binding protein, partial [Woeseiaceae bacterium]